MNLEKFKEYLIQQELSTNTIDTYIRGVRIYFEKYKDVKPKTIILYKEWLKKLFKPQTVNVRINGILSYCKFVRKPVSIKGLKIQKTLSVENVITKDEFDTLINGLKQDNNYRGYWLIMYLAKTGARASEFVRLSKSGLLRGFDEMYTKGKIRRIYYPSTLINDSSNYFNNVNNNLLFPSIQSNKQMTTRGLSGILQKYSKQYGIRKEVMHPHGFRHFYAKEFLKNGGDLALLSDLLGHEDLSTTAIYARNTTKEMSEKLSRLMA